MSKQTITMKRDKDCKHSVRFAADPSTDPSKPNSMDSVYVMRSFAGINEAKQVTVTIEVP